MICVNDLSNPAELHAIAPDLNWRDAYGGSVDYYQPDDRKPILAVPLVNSGAVIGVLKFLGPANNTFNEFYQQIAKIVSQIIAGTIRQTWTVGEQENTIIHLIEMGVHNNPQVVAEAATKRMQRMLNCSRSELYLRTTDGLQVSLAMVNGEAPVPTAVNGISRSVGLIGWIFKTGKPLNIPDARCYSQRQYLEDADLETISDNAVINPEDRWLRCPINWTGLEDTPRPFLAVPVQAEDGAILGVLAASCSVNGHPGRRDPFNHADLQLCQFLAYTISLSIQNQYDRQLNEFLIDLGYTWDPKLLYQAVIKELPGLIPGVDCSIYALKQAYDGKRLELVQTSQPGARMPDGSVMNLIYAIGDGKAGFCAEAQATLLLNHFGSGPASADAIQKKKAWLAEIYPDDLVEDLRSSQAEVVGIIQLLNGRSRPEAIQQKFKMLSQKWVFQPGEGLPSTKAGELLDGMSNASWSLISAPVREKSTGLFGVINVWRPADPSPFTKKNITLVEAVAARLAAVLSNLDLQEQRTRWMTTLAHEINIPMVGILADSENLMNEAKPGSELYYLSRHSLEQVQRLQMQTETILAVLSNQTLTREFKVHNIYRPLIEACELFRSEAALKGCDILRPETIGGSFPDIEMSLLDLSIAFKNVIHNAVKYSFRPPTAHEFRRYVRIQCRAADPEKMNYRISIQNYGLGISDEEIEKRLIFQPFYRGERATDRRRTGAGFGLAYARQVIEGPPPWQD